MSGQVHGTVEINATDYPYTSPTITLDEIRRLGSIPSDHRVYAETPGPEDDREVLPGDVIDVHRFRKFYSVSPAISGGCANA
jgi:hypothetical protein